MVEAAFVLDATGSMGSHLKKAKDKIRQLVRKIQSAYPNLTLRVALILYRDVDVDAKHQVRIKKT